MYSVIIPHRNSPDLLKRAMASVPDRNDIQIIVVDNSQLKLDFNLLEKKKECNYIFAYSNKKKGAGHARNMGLKLATGNWLLFLDADDFFNPGAFNQFDKFSNSYFDIVYFSATSEYLGTQFNSYRNGHYTKMVYEFINKKKDADDNLRYWFTVPWAKLIKREIVQRNNIHFEEVPASNDLMFSVKCGFFANKVWAVNFPVYCVSINEGSLTKTISVDNFRSRFCVAIRQYKFMTSINRPDLRFNLLALVLKSFQFGVT
jgi:glycosyltransferase involved in cell wall biosynthesis